MPDTFFCPLNCSAVAEKYCQALFKNPFHKKEIKSLLSIKRGQEDNLRNLSCLCCIPYLKP